MKKTSGRSRTDPHKRNVIGTNPKKQHRKGANNIVNNHHIIMAWCTIKYDACPVQWSMIWQNARTILQIKWSSICNELHIDETPRQVFSSISFMYPTILNVVKHGKRVKQSNTTYLVKFKWGRKQRTTILENHHMHILGLVLFCPKHNFRVIKHAK